MAATPTPAPHPTPTPAPIGMFGHGSPLANLDVLDVSMKMTGHTTTVGLPSTGLAFDLHVAGKGQKTPVHLSATMQLSDVYGGFPLSIDASIDGGISRPQVKLSFAVDDLTRVTPPLAGFRVPAGYRRAASIGAVIFNGSAPRAVSPLPAPSLIPMPTPTPSPNPSPAS